MDIFLADKCDKIIWWNAWSSIYNKKNLWRATAYSNTGNPRFMYNKSSIEKLSEHGVKNGKQTEDKQIRPNICKGMNSSSSTLLE